MSSTKTILGYEVRNEFEEEIIAQNERIIELLQGISDAFADLSSALMEAGDEK